MEVIIVITLSILVALAGSLIIMEDTLNFFLKGLLMLFIILACLHIGDKIAQNNKSKQKEQTKYKQEIVYSLKDGKYLPTDTIYTEIR